MCNTLHQKCGHTKDYFSFELQCPEEVKANTDAAYNYGRSIGIAYGLINDILDYEASSKQLGKATANDLKHGLATAPLLFATAKFPDLEDMIKRRFNKPGDVEKAFEFVSTTLYETLFQFFMHFFKQMPYTP